MYICMFIFILLIRHPLIKLFHISNLLQMLNNHRVFTFDFFGNLYSIKKISLVMALSWMLSLLMTSHCIHHFQGSCLLCKTS